MNKSKSQPKDHTQYEVKPMVFDAYNPNLSIQQALGSQRGGGKLEAFDIRSVNYVPGVSGWRLTPTGLELGNSSGVFPPGTVTFTDIQNISTDKILGRDTAGSGSIEQLGLGTGLVITGANLTLSFTKAQLDGLVSDGNVLYVGDVTQYTDEMAQDAVGATFDETLYYNDAGPYMGVAKQMSITNDASGLKLSGDATSPGNNQYYGTDGSGTKGWYTSVLQSVTPVISTGTAAPATTPTKVGDLYVDTNNKKLYVATGTTNSSDWTITN